MLKNILSDYLYKILNNHVNFKSINEIRLRRDKPIVLSIGGHKVFLGESGITKNLKDAICASKVMIEDIIFRASECSIYSVNEQIKKGFIVMKNGVRIGIGGDLIEENDKIKTMTNYSSVNIRIPHEILNCSLPVFNALLTEQGPLNTLIVSPPGAGKTTFLRDIVWQISERNLAFNILVLDERGEIDLGANGNIGNFADKICFAKKMVGFENGIRALSPNIIVTDELGTEEDFKAVEYASNCGVNIFATIHCDSMEGLQNKLSFENLLKKKVFKRFILLSLRNGPGTIEGVYNENFSRVLI